MENNELYINFSLVNTISHPETGEPIFKGKHILKQWGISSGMTSYCDNMSEENWIFTKDGISRPAYYITYKGIEELKQIVSSRRSRKPKRRSRNPKRVALEQQVITGPVEVRVECKKCGEEKLLSEFGRNDNGDVRCTCNECIDKFKAESTAEFIALKDDMRKVFTKKIIRCMEILGDIRKYEKEIVDKEYTPKNLLKLIETEESLEFLDDFRTNIQLIIDKREAFGGDINYQPEV